jgi:hypothetical protein
MLPFTLNSPFIKIVSYIILCRNVVFPHPTCPTTAKKFPCLMLIFSPYSVGSYTSSSSASPNPPLPFSICSIILSPYCLILNPQPISALSYFMQTSDLSVTLMFRSKTNSSIFITDEILSMRLKNY